VTWLTRKPEDSLTAEQQKLVWNKDKRSEESTTLMDTIAQRKEDESKEERHPLLANKDKPSSWISKVQKNLEHKQREVKVCLSVLLIVCIYTIEFIFR